MIDGDGTPRGVSWLERRGDGEDGSVQTMNATVPSGEGTLTKDLTSSDFLDEVRRTFSRLVDQGRLSVASSSYDRETFGNAIVILDGRNFRLRVVRDRGETFADLAGRGISESWHFFQRVLCVVVAAEMPKTFQISPESVAGAVEQNFVRLDGAFDPSQFPPVKKQLDEIAEAAGQEMLRRVKAGIPLE